MEWYAATGEIIRVTRETAHDEGPGMRLMVTANGKPAGFIIRDGAYQYAVTKNGRTQWFRRISDAAEELVSP